MSLNVRIIYAFYTIGKKKLNIIFSATKFVFLL